MHACRSLDPEACMGPGCPWLLDPESRFLDPDPGSRFEDPGPGSRILDRGPRVLDPCTWSPDPGPQVVDPGPGPALRLFLRTVDFPVQVC